MKKRRKEGRTEGQKEKKETTVKIEKIIWFSTME